MKYTPLPNIGIYYAVVNIFGIKCEKTIRKVVFFFTFHLTMCCLAGPKHINSMIKWKCQWRIYRAIYVHQNVEF